MLRKCGTLLNRRRIILPRTVAAVDESATPSGGFAPPSGVERFLTSQESEQLQQRRQLSQFAASTTSQNEQVWYDSKGANRKHQKLIDELGLDGAVREKLQPSRVSFQEELKRRPLDRQILEEIYRGMHGVRTERKLKKGVNWEHWIAKGDNTAPVFTASQNAKQTFGFGGKVERLAKATHKTHFPSVGGSAGSPLPEVAFVGRTGSGKSSLINAILNAHVCTYGHTQGTTRTCDFYSIGGRLIMVDLPGYGYYHPMHCPELDAQNATSLAKQYLRQGGTKQGGECLRNLRRVFVCISARGVQHSDVQYMNFLEELGIPFSVVLTKTDAAPIRFLARLADHTRCRLLAYKNCHELMLASSMRLSGIDKIQDLLGNIAMRGKEGSQAPIDTDFSSIV